jgi:cytosine deaminase
MMAPANEGVSVLANVRLGDEAADIVMQDGHISGIAPGLADATPTAMRIEGNGALALPGLVDGHMHLDKTLTGCAWIPHRAGPERTSLLRKKKNFAIPCCR